MQHITLFTIGRIKTDWIRCGCEEFLSRLQDVRLEVVELPAGKSADAEKQKLEECDRILSAVAKTTGSVFVLDERGKEADSQGFADMVERHADAGDSMVFVLGGAYGLDDRVRAAGKLLRLSPMTFTHEMCRLIFLEQLYRARQIIKDSGYHH